LHRLCNSPPAVVAASTLRIVQRLVDPNEVFALGEALLSADTQHALGVYRRWIDAANEQRPTRDAQLEKALFERVQREVPDVITEWKEFLQRPGFAKGRGAVALRRLVAPLVEAESSRGIERTHTELSTEEFQRFVRRRWDAETILLRRPPDLVRAQRLSGGVKQGRRAHLRARFNSTTA
jgi:hypothetical protein